MSDLPIDECTHPSGIGNVGTTAEKTVRQFNVIRVSELPIIDAHVCYRMNNIQTRGSVLNVETRTQSRQKQRF